MYVTLSHKTSPNSRFKHFEMYTFYKSDSLQLVTMFKAAVLRKRAVKFL